MQLYYGESVFLITTLIVSLLSIFNKKRNFFTALILAWFFPLTLYLLFFIHFKYQYWLPVALPLFSTWALIFCNKDGFRAINFWRKVIYILFTSILVAQFCLFSYHDYKIAKKQIFREKSNPSIQFYDEVREVLFSELNNPLSVYFDYRLYLPDDNNWEKTTSFDLLTYEYIQENHFDILILQQQRINDYLQEGLVGVNPVEFEKSQIFYRDAEDGQIDGYNLIFRDEVGLVFQK